MKNRVGILCMFLGAVLILGALLLSRMNMQEDTVAQEAVVEVMPQLVQQIKENTATESTVSASETIPGLSPEGELELQIPLELLTDEDKKMTEVEIRDNRYIGYLSLPDLRLELPIMSTWSYAKLNIAPCRYTGSVRGEDLVLMAHNYNSHFGRLSQLDIGDSVKFTDMEGVVTPYQVVGKDLLDPTAVEEMISGTFDLTLFTCTYGGKSRVTVYCDKV